jgi:acetyl-CoA carboxylase carboxyl transferase subunit beta
MVSGKSQYMANEPESKWNGFSLKPRKDMPAGLWMRCPGCEHMLYKSAVEKNLNVCPQCNHHFRIETATRIKYLTDEGSFEEALSDLTTQDPLGFKFRGISYKQRLKADEKKSGAREAMRIGKAFIKGRGVILGVMEPNFLMGSMGFVVGEKLCVAVEKAIEESCMREWYRWARWPRHLRLWRNMTKPAVSSFRF